MDLSNLKAQSRVIEILHPVTEEPIGLDIELLPTSDPKMKKAQRDFLDRKIEGSMNSKEIDLEQCSIDYLACAVKSWKWNGDLNWRGVKPEATNEIVKQVLSELNWLKNQIDVELAKKKEFFRTTGTEV